MIGKLSPEELKKYVLSEIHHRRSEILTGLQIGEDSAQIKTDEILLMTTDPITGGANDCGSLAVEVCCNDIAAECGEPIAIMLTVLMPKDHSLEDVNKIIIQAENTAQNNNVEIIGGHTEFTDAVNRPIVSATAIGKKLRKSPYEKLKEGHKIIVTKWLGLEGTSVIINNTELKNNISELDIIEAKSTSRMLSVMKEGILCSNENISYMHDITEGGIIGAICEILDNSGYGAIIYENSLPFLPCTTQLCNEYNIDPKCLLSSGSMLIVTSDCDKIMQKLRNENIKATIVGEIIKGNKVYLNKGNENIEVTAMPDEINKLFAEKVL